MSVLFRRRPLRLFLLLLFSSCATPPPLRDPASAPLAESAVVWKWKQPPPFEPDAVVSFGEHAVAVRALRSEDGLADYELVSSFVGDGREVLRTAEKAGNPRLRSGNVFLDAMFALALSEIEKTKVSEIRDGSGAKVPCRCFAATDGGKATLREVALSAPLALAALDPERLWATLWQGARGVPRGLAQEGPGVWPQATDRVAWALGVDSVLAELPAGRSRMLHLREAWHLLRAALQEDREGGVFDARDGLYRGVPPFLDEQGEGHETWTGGDFGVWAEGKSLSTNLIHFMALARGAAWGGELGFAVDARRFESWARQLRDAVRVAFLEPETGLLHALRFGALHPVTSPDRQDFLGLALAALTEILGDEEAREQMRRYPASEWGRPMAWPRIEAQPALAAWSSAFGFAALAGVRLRESPFVAEQALSLLRNLALPLGAVAHLDIAPGMGGPRLSASRETSLLAASAVVSLFRSVLFGVDTRGGQLVFSPFLPAGFVARFVGSQRQLRFEDLEIGGKHFSVTWKLPAEVASEPRSFLAKLKTLSVDGRKPGVPRPISVLDLREGSEIELVFDSWQMSVEDRNEEEAGPRLVTPTATPAILVVHPVESLAPRPLAPPQLALVEGGVRLVLEQRSQVVWDVFRNGGLVAKGLNVPFFEDRSGGDGQACYSVLVRHRETLLASIPSREVCRWRELAEPSRERGSWSFTATRSGLHAICLELTKGDPFLGSVRVRAVRAGDGRRLLDGSVASGSDGCSTHLFLSLRKGEQGLVRVESRAGRNGPRTFSGLRVTPVEEAR